MDPTPTSTAVDGLHALGFSETEAVLYCELLRSPGSTGYRLAQLTGKSQANTYQALRGLLRRGAVQVDDSEPRRHVPVPYPELLSKLRQGFEARFDTAARTLAELPIHAREPSPDQFQTLRQVHEKAAAMLDAAREAVAFNLFPRHFEALEPSLRKAVARGVRIAGSTYAAQHTLAGARIYLAGSPDRLLANTVGEKLVLITDAERLLIALTQKGSGELLRAVHSDDDLLSSWFHQGLISDLILEEIQWNDSANRFLFGGFPPGVLTYYRET